MELTVFLLDKCEEAGCESVSKTPQSLGQLLPLNSTGSILIKMPENALPIADVLPKAGEFLLYLLSSGRKHQLGLEEDHTLKSYGPVSIRVLENDMESGHCRCSVMTHEHVHQHLHSIQVKS
jgi:hypothetical protein